MASIYKRGDTWRVQVSMKGIRRNGTFDTKTAAQIWAAEQEKEILSGSRGEIPRKTFGELLKRYRDEVSPRKKSGPREAVRIDFFIREEAEVCQVYLQDLRTNHFSEMRDRRLDLVTGETIRRDFNLLSAALNTAVREWGWLKENPLSKVRRPPPGKERDTRILPEQEEKLLFVCGYNRDYPCETVGQRVAAAFRFAIETAMRAGEICSLDGLQVDLQRRVARLEKTKNGDVRDVPLSLEAIHILKQLQPWEPTGKVFRLTSSQLDANYRKHRERAALGDIHFHDTRHEAITRLAKKLKVLELARMVGHRNINQLLTYYNESAEELATRLN